ncbi:MAG TPA: hypothetical protein VGS21_02280, partial [Acidimicrobiales bacterium]|nr:hypothetical protein [Acidimicrobiales bacterium]
MANRHFGTVRQRASGRWQGLYFHDGRVHSAGTFRRKADALARLAEIEVELRRGNWTDPRAGRIQLGDYADRWLSRRPDLAVRSRELYVFLLSKYIVPEIGQCPLNALTPSVVRDWHAALAARLPSTAAKCYRLLSTITKAAVADGVIASSPCRIVGASVEHPAERPMATLEDVARLSEGMPEHLRIVVTLATWCQLRRGEILGLRRMDVDSDGAFLHIEQSRTFLRDGSSLVKAPKTRAGRRGIAVPTSVMKELVHHLAQFVPADGASFVVVDRNGKPVTAAMLQRAWSRSRR